LYEKINVMEPKSIVSTQNVVEPKFSVINLPRYKFKQYAHQINTQDRPIHKLHALIDFLRDAYIYTI
ncbi:MAG: hypothetical protein OXF08_00605, partial [Bacteroidetes bacterium]|nr:hypothetical protein [Bacteroidota bacterium]